MPQIYIHLLSSQCSFHFPTKASVPGVCLIDYDKDAIDKVVTSLLFPYSNCDMMTLQEHVKNMDDEERSKVIDAACNARENRRHKSPRALENAFFTFEIVADFGCYRDLQRHRILTQDKQLLSCRHGYFVPNELKGTIFEKDYCEALEKAKKTYDTISVEFPEEAQYIVPMAYNIRWYFNINIRSLQWMCELRSQAAGHSNYRFVVQQMAKMVCEKFPVFESFFGFVDYNDYSLGRLQQEQNIVKQHSPGEIH